MSPPNQHITTCFRRKVEPRFLEFSFHEEIDRIAGSRFSGNLKGPVLPVLFRHQGIGIRRGNIGFNSSDRRSPGDPFFQGLELTLRGASHEIPEQFFLGRTGSTLDPLNHETVPGTPRNKCGARSSAFFHPGDGSHVEIVFPELTPVTGRATEQGNRQNVVLIHRRGGDRRGMGKLRSLRNPFPNHLLFMPRQGVALLRHLAPVNQFIEKAVLRIPGGEHRPRFTSLENASRRTEIEFPLSLPRIVTGLAVLFQDRRDVVFEQ